MDSSYDTTLLFHERNIIKLTRKIRVISHKEIDLQKINKNSCMLMAIMYSLIRELESI